MALSFFRALNPVSRNSGVQFMWENDPTEDGPIKVIMEEMQDKFFSERISKEMSQRTGRFYTDDGILNDLFFIHTVLTGRHYYYSTYYFNYGGNDGYKGLLDYLIFPLIARKLIADAKLDERKEAHFTNALAWTIAIPLEIVRIAMAFALTLLFVPIVAIARLIKICVPEQHEETISPFSKTV